MRVAIYTGTYKKNQDGATKTLYELVDTLLGNDIEVGIWAFDITTQKTEGLKLHAIPSVPLPLYTDYRISLPFPRIKKQLDAFSPDVIHITVPDLVGIHIMRYSRLMGIPVLTSFHTDFPSYLKSYGLGFLTDWSWTFFKWFYNQSQVVLAPTRNMVDRLQDHHINPVKIWSRGIHLDRYNPTYRSSDLRRRLKADKKHIILYSGRFVWYKDLETFIGVYDMFKQWGPDNVAFVLAGDGPIREELRNRMPEAHFTGYLQGDELSRIYASSDILLFPSTTETFGNVVLEALASGLPAVVSDTGGCQEIVANSGAGLVAESGNVNQFYQGCRQLVQDPEVYRRIRSRGLKYVENNTWSQVNNTVIQEYSHLVMKRTGKSKQVRLPVLANN